MAFLAEVQYYTAVERRPPEIVDCAALIRYCYREALRFHDSAWAQSAHLALVPAIGSVAKYNYPRGSLGPALFRVRSGPFSTTDLHNGTFAEFATAETILHFNTFLVSRDIHRAEMGDLVFFRRRNGAVTYHSMIFIGESQIAPSRNAYVVYNTGPEGKRGGEMRRLTVSELLRFPDPQWRPDASNPQFLGVYRWNILRDFS